MGSYKGIDYKYWDRVATELVRGDGFDELLAAQYRRVHLDLIERWAGTILNGLILKTDLFAEALSPSRAFLWDILKHDNYVVAIDLSAKMVSRARSNALRLIPDTMLRCVNSDLRQLPFAAHSFDLIISDSSLDHFTDKQDISRGLFELSRVLKPGGTLLITMDNKDNLTEPFLRLWIWLKLPLFFIGKTLSMKELKQALHEVGLQVTDTTAIIHNPRFFTKLAIKIIRKVRADKNDSLIKKCLDFFDSLEHKKTKLLTAQFVAAKAVKPYNQ